MNTLTWSNNMRCYQAVVSNFLRVVCFALFCLVIPLVEGSEVDIIVEPTLYNEGEITHKLQRYINDITIQGYTPTLVTESFADAEALRDYLEDRYTSQGIEGAVFIGDIPIAMYEDETGTFPCDLFFQDIDGLWEDTDKDSYYDLHRGNVIPEIWTGRLLTSPLTSLHDGRTEAGLLNSYFEKNHSFRTGELSVEPRGLIYIDDEWVGTGPIYRYHILKSITDGCTFIDTIIDGKYVPYSYDTTKIDMLENISLTTSTHYKKQIRENEYESLFLSVHSTFESHAFDSKRLKASELENIDPQCLFYVLNACSNANFSKKVYMAGEYVFGTSKGLVALGSTKTGGILYSGVKQLYPALGEGETWGQAVRTMFRGFESGWNSSIEFNYYGMALIGDPFLTTQQYRSKLTVVNRGSYGSTVVFHQSSMPKPVSRYTVFDNTQSYNSYPGTFIQLNGRQVSRMVFTRTGITPMVLISNQ